MVKLFGKLRYHWQPELSLAIIYWSMTISPIFLALSLLYERTSVPVYVFLLFGLFVVLAGLGLHRYFTIEDKGILKVASFNIFSSKLFIIKDICKIEITKYSLTLVMVNGSRFLCYMRKWPKKYFLDALAVHEDFCGEVELLDNHIAVDYFLHYQDDKKALTRE